MNALIQELMISSCQCFTDDFKGDIHRANTINRPNIINTSLQKSDDDAWISTTNKWDNSNIYTYTTSKWIIMAPKEKLLFRTILKIKGSQQDNLSECMKAHLLR